MSNNPILFLAQRGWHYASNKRSAMILYGLMFVVAVSITLAEPYVIGKALSAVQIDMKGNATTSSAALLKDMSWSFYLYFLIQLTFWLIHGPARVIERDVAFHIKTNYKKHLFRVVTHQSIQWHRVHHSGESIDKINRAAVALGGFFDGSFQVIYMIVRLLGALVILFCFMPFAGWMAIAATLLAFANIFLFDLKLYEHYYRLNRFENSAAAAVHDYITNIGSVIALRLENRVMLELGNRLIAPLSVFRRNIVMIEIKWFVTTMLIATTITVVLIQYANGQISSGQGILAGSLFTLYEYLRRIGDSFYNFASLYGTIVRQAADVASADAIIDGASQSDTSKEQSHLPDDWRSIEIQNLIFCYEDENKKAHELNFNSLQLLSGKTVALLGASGCGKSTLLSLLRGLQQPQSAKLLVDGSDLPEGLLHLSEHTTLIPQDPEIFADTIRFNITFGLESDEKEIQQAVEIAAFEPVLARLPKGLDTNIAEKGVNLSGGEKQRLALARGIFFARQSDILLLDEATSSVDLVNEQNIYERLFFQYRDKCIVCSMHKLHLLPLFDMIYLLDHGRIIESGSLETLLQLDGRLAKLWRQYQEKGFNPEVDDVDLQVVPVLNNN